MGLFMIKYCSFCKESLKVGSKKKMHLWCEKRRHENKKIMLQYLALLLVRIMSSSNNLLVYAEN